MKPRKITRLPHLRQSPPQESDVVASTQDRTSPSQPLPFLSGPRRTGDCSGEKVGHQRLDSRRGGSTKLQTLGKGGWSQMLGGKHNLCFQSQATPTRSVLCAVFLVTVGGTEARYGFGRPLTVSKSA